jgi:TonB family protein
MTELNKAIVLGGPPRSISSLQANPRLKSIASALGHRGLIWLRKGNEIEARRDLVDCLKLNPCARPRLEDQMRSSGMQQYLNSILPPPDKQETACVQKAGDGFLFAGSKDVVTPVALATPKPRYTEEARRARKQGTVVIQFVVRKDGTAANFRVIKGLGFGLDESAINTIAREWRFKPGTYKGDPADVQIIVEMLFKLF